MTKDEKNAVIRMRGQQQSYKTISETLGISLNTIRSFCRRRNLQGDCRSISNTGNCKSCGRLIMIKKGHRPRQFCSDTCRQRWWNDHLGDVQRKAVYAFTCASCGKEFTSYGNQHRKYCSRGCYIIGRYGGKEAANE